MGVAGARACFVFRAVAYLAVVGACLAMVIAMGLLKEFRSWSDQKTCSLSYRINSTDGKKGSDAPCDYVLFSGCAGLVLGLVLFISSTVTLCRGSYTATNFVLLELILVILGFIAMLAASGVATGEITEYCDAGKKEFPGASCSDLDKAVKGTKNTWERLQAVEFSGWVATCLLFIVIFPLFARFRSINAQPKHSEFNNPNAPEHTDYGVAPHGHDAANPFGGHGTSNA